MSDSLTPARPQPRTHRIFLEDLEVSADIGFHDFEIGVPQRVLVTVEVTIDLSVWPGEDNEQSAWNYDFIRTGIHDLLRGRRFNLQEILAEEIFTLIADRPGVTQLTVRTRKPDIYPDAKSVGVVLSSEG